MSDACERLIMNALIYPSSVLKPKRICYYWKPHNKEAARVDLKATVAHLLDAVCDRASRDGVNSARLSSRANGNGV